MNVSLVCLLVSIAFLRRFALFQLGIDKSVPTLDEWPPSRYLSEIALQN
jgi:hypothetical protein